MINVLWKFTSPHWEVNDTFEFGEDRDLAEFLIQVARRGTDSHIIVNHIEMPIQAVAKNSPFQIEIALRFIRQGLIVPEGAAAQRKLNSDQHKR